MKATGIVRRIDDLGRVVIPKEIRRTMRIREGDPLEIYTEKDGEVILKKYSPIGELSQFSDEYAASACNILGGTILITDTDQIVAVSGSPRKTFLGKKISKDVESIIHNKDGFVTSSSEQTINLTIEDSEVRAYVSQIVIPIISQGDSIGSIIVLSSTKDKIFGDVELKTAEIGADFLARQMDN